MLLWLTHQAVCSKSTSLAGQIIASKLQTQMQHEHFAPTGQISACTGSFRTYRSNRCNQSSRHRCIMSTLHLQVKQVLVQLQLRRLYCPTQPSEEKTNEHTQEAYHLPSEQPMSTRNNEHTQSARMSVRKNEHAQASNQ